MSGKENSVKTLFLIANYFSGVCVGLSLFAIGLGYGLMLKMYDSFIGLMVVGIAVFVMSLVGHYGAVHDNRKVLDSYSFLMTSFAVFEVIQVVMMRHDLSPDSKVPPQLRFEKYFIFSIFVTTITMFSTLLAYYLGAQIRFNEKTSNAATASTTGSP